MTRFKDMDPDDDTRLLQYEIRKALALPPAASRPMSALYRLASRVGPSGYTALGEHFIDAVTAGKTPRFTVSRLITDLVLSAHDEQGATVPREGSMSHAVPFMNVLVRETPKTVVEWVEDVATENASLAIVRGIVFGATFDQREACLCDRRQEGKKYRVFSSSFWDMAVASDLFPLSIFSTPCASVDGIVFSNNRRFVIGTILARTFESTVRRIAAHIVTHATHKFVWTYDKEKERYEDVPELLSDTERLLVLKELHDAVDAPQARRAFVAEALGIPL